MGSLFLPPSIKLDDRIRTHESNASVTHRAILRRGGEHVAVNVNLGAAPVNKNVNLAADVGVAKQLLCVRGLRLKLHSKRVFEEYVWGHLINCGGQIYCKTSTETEETNVFMDSEKSRARLKALGFANLAF